MVDAYAIDWPSALVGVEPDRSAARAADKPTAASIGSSLNSVCGHASMGLLPDTVGHVLAVRRR